LSSKVSIIIYLDTNVFTRPFDDQRNSNIREEANAFYKIIENVKNNKLRLLCSDILAFEVHNILRKEYFSAMNVTRFVEKLLKGEL